jgi:hypothetical protein
LPALVHLHQKHHPLYAGQMPPARSPFPLRSMDWLPKCWRLFWMKNMMTQIRNLRALT